MKLTRKVAIIEMLDRLERRRELLIAKCIESLTTTSDLSTETATNLTDHWSNLIETFRQQSENWQTQAAEFGRWAAEQKIPFESIIALLHYYKQAVTPLLKREYEGIEGYMEANLALDQLLTVLMGHIPPAYFAQ